MRVGAPMERIAVDLMGPLNETDRHNRYILVVQDYFSKWVEAYPVPNEQASTVAEKIACEWHKVGDAVWYLVKGTKSVKNQVRKFLPSYEGPYFVVGLLDDLVYRIKKSSRAKAKVVHHDKLKPYYSRTPLD
ncbi:hypothetical protein L3Q82_025356, partial [Scortum barcoo]